MTQLWAIAAVRRLDEVRVFSPTPANRKAFARRARAEVGLSVAVVDGAEASVGGAEIVVSDSPAQAASLEESYFTSRDLTHLGAVASGEQEGRMSAGDVTLFCSTGLAGSEVVVSAAFFAP